MRTMRLPKVHGVIRRRLLVNFRVPPEIIQRQLPKPFVPKVHNGHAIAGICLIRLEDIRPKRFPRMLGLSSENAGIESPSAGKMPRDLTKGSTYRAATPDRSSATSPAGVCFQANISAPHFTSWTTVNESICTCDRPIGPSRSR